MSIYILRNFSLSEKLAFIVPCSLCLVVLFQVCPSDAELFFGQDEAELASEFRTMIQDFALKDYMISDGYLQRWLKVNDYDLDKTFEKFVQSMKWRTDNNIDQILQEDFSAIDEFYPFAIEGVDKSGRPIVWVPLGVFDMRRIVIGGVQPMYQRYMMRIFEMVEVYLHKLRQSTGRDNITQVVMIFDLAGFNVKTGACLRCIGMIPELMNNREQNYPIIFNKTYHINTPAVFESVLRVAKNLMSKQTSESLEIYDYDKDKWRAALLQRIPADQLPVQYGGTKPTDYYTIAANRTHFVSSVAAFAQLDSHNYMGVEVGQPSAGYNSLEKILKHGDNELTANENNFERNQNKGFEETSSNSSNNEIISHHTAGYSVSSRRPNRTLSEETPHLVRHQKHSRHHHFKNAPSERIASNRLKAQIGRPDTSGAVRHFCVIFLIVCSIFSDAIAQLALLC